MGDELLADSFEVHRAHLRGIAYRMLGSMPDADDAVQEAWIRLSRSDTSEVVNLGGWLTTVVARVCLDMLQSRRSHPVEPLDAHDVEPPTGTATIDPEREALLADSVGLALLVVLDTLTPAERLAFVLHDMFAVPFEEIAPIVDRSPAATRQLASRARRRVQGTDSSPDADPARRQEVVSAFLAASRGGDFEALLTVLDPDVVVRADAVAVRMGADGEVSGRQLVATNFSGRAQGARLALIDGVPGAVWAVDGKPRVAFTFGIAGEKITAIMTVADPDVLGQLDIEYLEEAAG